VKKGRFSSKINMIFALTRTKKRHVCEFSGENIFFKSKHWSLFTLPDVSEDSDPVVDEAAEPKTRYDRLGLDRQKREEIGRRSKRVIDQGSILQNSISAENFSDKFSLSNLDTQNNTYKYICFLWTKLFYCILNPHM
jgi:hypothetical protein